MLTCYILIGVPGSGKSTWVKSKNKIDDFIIASSDDVIEKVSNKYGFTYSETFKDLIKFAQKVFEHNIQSAINLNKNIIIDRTNLNPKTRKKFIDLFKNTNRYKIVGVFFETPNLAEWNKRLNSRKGKFISQSILNSMVDNLVCPSLDEGFDEIINANNL